jgi:hypothetical protein
MTQPLHRRRLPDETIVRSWLNRLNGFGARLTGNTAHRDAIDFIESELRASGLKTFRDRLPFARWEARACELTLLCPDGSAVPLEPTSYFPYSGTTPAQGVEGEIVYYRWPPWSFAAAAGKIAVVNVTVPTLPRFLLRLAFRTRTRVPETADFGRWFTSPLLAMAWMPDLAAAARAGVRAVVCVWRRCTPDNAAFQYIPFDTALQGCPAIWVDNSAGDRLARLARQRGRVRLKLEATLDRNAETDTLYAIVPRKTAGEAIIVNTHTDGPNACEENGPVGVLALAQHFIDPQPQRTIVFVFVTGHFQLPQLGNKGQATKTWLQQHPELWDGQPGHLKAVAGVTLEHLGAMEWKDAEGTYKPTGEIELELVYTANQTLDRVYVDKRRKGTLRRTMTLRPVNDIYFGEGEPLYRVGIPTISLVPFPDYLCAAAPTGYIEKLDPKLMYEQIKTFADVVDELDQTPAASIGPPEPEPWTLLRILVLLVRRVRPV